MKQVGESEQPSHHALKVFGNMPQPSEAYFKEPAGSSGLSSVIMYAFHQWPRFPIPIPILIPRNKRRRRRARRRSTSFALVQSSSLREWIMYHSWLGIERWFIYDNNSDDGIKEVVYLGPIMALLGVERESQQQSAWKEKVTDYGCTWNFHRTRQMN
ncbi:hypothetical protein U1Q18_035122 [Sarracenia purpurea var. burkii]